MLLQIHRCLINTGVEKNEPSLNIDQNFDHQMSQSKSKFWYSNNCLHFLKRTVPLAQSNISGKSRTCQNVGCSAQVGYGHGKQYQPRLKILTTDKRTSLFQNMINDEEKKMFCYTGIWGRIHNTIFFATCNGPNKLACFSLAGLSSLSNVCG